VSALRARYPDHEGHVQRDGVRTFYEVYGEGDPALLFVPGGMLVHSRMWKGQIPWFAQRHRVLAFDGRGNGKSDRPLDGSAYDEREIAADALAVLDATDTAQAVVVAGGRGCYRALLLAADHPERVLALFLCVPDHWLRQEFVDAFLADPKEHYGEGWDRLSPHYFRENWEDFLWWWMALGAPEPHCTRAIEHAVHQGLETTPEIFAVAAQGRGISNRELPAIAERVRCPTLVLRGGRDAISPPEQAELVARLTRGELITLEEAGHTLWARNPVRFNLILRRFLSRVTAPVMPG
jgi:pimeloyl-ACP methyl ester carboxylesterase